MFFTFQDAIDQLTDYLGGNPSEVVVRDAKRAIIEAYRTFINASRWTYLYTHGRLITSLPYVGGDVGATIQYQGGGGTYPDQVTLSGGTWPGWAADGYLRITGFDPAGQVDQSNYSNLAFRVDQRKSATVLTLKPPLVPANDIQAGAGFTLYQDTYLLPDDFIDQDQALYERNFGGMTYTHPRDWLYENRYVFAQGVPTNFTITGDPKYPGKLVMRIFPWPTDTKTIDFIYRRRPRALVIAKATAGTASVASGSNSVTATQSAFTPAMVGSVLRLGADATHVPTSFADKYPAAFESVIVAYVTPTQVTTLDACPGALAGVAFLVSDPIDIELGAMANAFHRCCEMHISMNRTLKDKPSARLQYADALGAAKDADSRSFAGRAAGPPSRFRPRLRDMPTGPDEP